MAAGAGVAAFASALGASFLAGSLLAGVAVAGAVTAGLASAFLDSSFLAGSAAKAETVAIVAIRAINCFIVISLIRNCRPRLSWLHIYNATACTLVDTILVFCYNLGILSKKAQMELHVEAGPKTKRYIEALVPSMLTQLGLDKNRKLLMIKMDSELEEMGTTIPMTGIDTYLVVLKPTRNLYALGVTLAHELVHVRQMAKGILQIMPKGRRKWKGKSYGRDVAYLQQPWELDAFARQEIVFRRAIEL